MKSEGRATSTGSYETYLSEIRKFSLLSVEDERNLARLYKETGDTRAAHQLVTANLRFVVRVANEYRSYGLRLPDLIQEGNIGLMRAVQKFEPDRGIRLISYAVWWIRAYIQNHILRSWSLVKIGTTQAQRRLFFSLARTRREIERQSARLGVAHDGQDAATQVARKLRVKPAEVREMEQRLDGRDLSLDAPVGDEGGHSHVESVAGEGPSQHEMLSGAEEQSLLSSGVVAALEQLDERERFIVEARIMSEQPMTLKELGEHFGFSRERARQLEIRARQKLRQHLRPVAVAADWPTDGAPVEIEDRLIA